MGRNGLSPREAAHHASPTSVRAAPEALHDPRARRSSDALSSALLRLLECKPLDQITIREIAAEAGVHRSTFFRHHPTKEALLDHIAANQIRDLVALTLPVLDSKDSLASLQILCAYVDEHRTLWSALLTGGAAGAMREEWLRLSREVADTRSVPRHWIPVPLGIAYSVALLFETMAWWLGEPEGTVSIDRVAEILNHLFVAVQSPEAPAKKKVLTGPRRR